MQQIAQVAYLVINQSGRWNDVFRLAAEQKLVIGRASSNQIVVADERCSRHHAEITFAGDRWVARDLGSRNGTIVNGQPIEGDHKLLDGDVVEIAFCKMTFTRTLGERFVDETDGLPNPSIERTREIPRDAIMHRSNSAMWLSEDVSDLVQQSLDKDRPVSKKAAGPVPTATEIASGLFRLAFELASEASIEAACEKALAFLSDRLPMAAGGVLAIASSRHSRKPKPTTKTNSYTDSLVLVSTVQTGAQPYRRVHAALVETVLREKEAVLAKNFDVQTETSATGPQDSSSLAQADSVICAPIYDGKTMLGVLHLFSQGGQRRFEHADLEIAMAVAQTLAVVFTNLTRQKRLQQKLKESTRTIDSLRGQLAGTVEMIGQSPALQLVQTQVAKVAPTNATVLIRGESGVGKELIARAIHVASPRAEKPFVAINCAALSMTLLESELFGHEKGAFTGASDLKIGKFELADGGTLMLDEIGEMNSEIQAKFLRALEGKPFERVGGSQSVAANVRVVAATNRDLEEAVREGNFRSDLYFRLRVIEIVVPPLRQRVEDILPLAAHFLTTISAQLGHGPSGFSASAEQALQTHSWPGNIRELRNAIERAVVLSTGELAEPDDLALSNVNVPGQSLPATPPILNVPYRERSIAEVEQDHVVATLEATEGNKSRAAAILGIERSTLDRKLKKYE